MKIIKLKEPIPRPKSKPTQAFGFFYTGFLPLPKGAKHPQRSLTSVLSARRSLRNFDAPLSFSQLAALIWQSARIREKRFLENGTKWESRIAPSAGGCHPIHIVIIGAPDFPRDVLVYDAEHNGFGIVGSVDARLLRKTIREIDRCLRVQKGTALCFLADVARTENKYVNPESLIWRDSGALLATISLVAESMGIQSCGLGIHDTASLRKMLKLPASVIGVGGCIVSS